MGNPNLEAQGNKKELVIVTGSSGMIGSALIHKLAEKYHAVGFDQAELSYSSCRNKIFKKKIKKNEKRI